jgi:RHS repeat-associated protein
VERYVYDPFGAATVLDASWGARGVSLFAWRYLFQGLRYDPTSGLYYARNRDYSPTLGRWLQTDPLGLAAGDSNVYRFVGNSPTYLSDPTGLAAPRLVPPAGLAALGAVAESYEDLGDPDKAAQALTDLDDCRNVKPLLTILKERWKPTFVPDKRIDQLINQFLSNAFQERQDATDELEKLGLGAYEMLRRALEAGPRNLEMQQRLQRLLEPLERERQRIELVSRLLAKLYATCSLDEEERKGIVGLFRSLQQIPGLREYGDAGLLNVLRFHQGECAEACANRILGAADALFLFSIKWFRQAPVWFAVYQECLKACSKLPPCLLGVPK